MAARSSSRRAATTSSPAANPPAASHSLDRVGVGRGPAGQDGDHRAPGVGGEQVGGAEGGVVEVGGHDHDPVEGPRRPAAPHMRAASMTGSVTEGRRGQPRARRMKPNMPTTISTTR